MATIEVTSNISILDAWQMLFVVMKLMGYLTMPWWVVLLPYIIWGIIVVIAILVD